MKIRNYHSGVSACFSCLMLLSSRCVQVADALQSNLVESPQSLTQTICTGRPRSQCEVQLDVPQACVSTASNTDPACPIVFFLHGSGGNIQWFSRTSGVHDAGFIGVYPQGESGWNTGPKPTNQCSWDNFDCTQDPDEGDFIAAIIEELRSQGASGNIYAIGNSNGAALAYRLASNAGNELPIKGIVAKVTQLLASPERSGPGVLNYNQPRAGITPAVSVLSIMGTDDTLIPYGGGSSGVFSGDNAFQLMPSIDSMEFWASHNGCDGTFSIDDNYLTDQGSGTATKYQWDCPSGTLLEHYAIHGGGHNAGGASIDGDKIDYVIAFDFINRVETTSTGGAPTATSPTLAPPTSISCVNDINWAGKFDAAHTCEFVAQLPDQRCNWESADGTLAKTACAEACGNCASTPNSAPSSAPVVTQQPVTGAPSTTVTTSCVNDINWAGKFDVAHTCEFVAQLPDQRCNWESADGTQAKTACAEACGNCPSTPISSIRSRLPVESPSQASSKASDIPLNPSSASPMGKIWIVLCILFVLLSTASVLYDS